MLALFSPILGGLLGFVFLRIIGFKRFSGGDIVLGLVIFFISIFIQQPVQQLPIIYIAYITSALSELMKGGSPLEFQKKIIEYFYSLGWIYIVPFSIWLGYVAGFIQSVFKYVFIQGKSYTVSINIGLGFGLIEAFYVGIAGFIGILFSGQVDNAPVYYYAISSLERFSALLFHVGSTLYLYDAWTKNRGVKGLLLIVGIHGSLDTFAALYQLTASPFALVTVEILVLIAGLTLTLRLYKSALTEIERK